MRSRATLAAVLALLGFLLVLALTTEPPRREGAESRRSQLIDLIETRREEIDDLDARVASLRNEVTSAQDEVAAAGDDEARERREKLQDAAGLTSRSGSGLRITLDDPPPELVTDPRAAPFQIIDRDLQRLVNALWAAGADAVSIGGERLVATSAIRNGGDTITVNFRPLAPPYEIIAPGADVDALEGSHIARDLHRWTERYGVTFDVEVAGDLEVPGYQARTRLQYATPIASGERRP
ncbi:MAG: DUF881 domain-containing protein [Acidimicrobiia bacterium]